MSEISWGTCKSRGSFSVKLPQLAKNNILNVYSNGDLCIPFGGINKTEREESVRDNLKDLTERKLGFSIPANYQKKYPIYGISIWEPKMDQLFLIIDRLLQTHPDKSGA